jgi:hypothetical protein
MQAAEDAVNGFIVDPINFALSRLPWPLSYLGKILPRACFTGFWKPGGKCWDGDVSLAAYLGCFATENARASRQCYFTRQRAICMSGDGSRYERYNALFEAPSGDELEAQYRNIVGDSFQAVDPTFAALFDSIDRSTLADDAQEAKQICDSNIYESMDLDEVRARAAARFSASIHTACVRPAYVQIILACFFHFIEGFCPSSGSSAEFVAFVKTIEWKLPKVTFDWSARYALLSTTRPASGIL